MPTDAPDTPCGHGPLATPIRYPWGELVTDRVDGPRDATLYCPACGHGWVGTPEDLAQATQALREYERDEGFPWRDEPVVTEEPKPVVRAVDPRQLELFKEAGHE